MPAVTGTPQAFAFTTSGTTVTYSGGGTADSTTFDILCVNSDNVVTTPAGWTSVASRINSQGSYIFARSGGATSAVLALGGGINSNTSVLWVRITGAAAVDTGATATAGVDGASGTSTPAVTSGALSAATELVVAFAALHGIGTGVPTAYTWSAGYTEQTSGAQGGLVGSAVAASVAVKAPAGTAAESPSVSWSSGTGSDRYILVAAFTDAGSSAVNGTAAVTGAGAVSATVVLPGADAVTGAGATSAAGAVRSTASISGAGVVAASGGVRAGRAVTGAGATSALAASRAGSAVAGSGAVTAGAGGATSGTAAVSGAGAVTAVGGTVGSGTATATGAGTATATAATRTTSTATGTGSTSAAGAVRGATAATGGGSVTATTRVQATATATGAGVVSASAGSIVFGAAAVASQGFVTASAGSRITPRPFAGTTSRPFAGVTTRP